MVKKYKVYEVDNEDHVANYIVTEEELVNQLVEPTLELQGDTEDECRKWLLAQPKINDVLWTHPSNLPIKRIS